MNKIHFSNPVHLVNPVYFLQRSATFQDDTAKLLGRGAGQPPRSPISGGAMRACEKELDKLRNDLWVQFLYYRAVGEKVKQKGDCPRESASRDCPFLAKFGAIPDAFLQGRKTRDRPVSPVLLAHNWHEGTKTSVVEELHPNLWQRMGRGQAGFVCG